MGLNFADFADFGQIREISASQSSAKLNPRETFGKRPDPRNLSFFPKNTLPTKTLDHKA